MRRETAFVLTAAFLWGTTFPATKYGLVQGGLEPLGFLLWRYIAAAASLIAIALWRGNVQWRLFADWRLWALGLGNAMAYLLQYVGQDITTASKTSLLVNVNVLVTAVLAWWLLHERIGRGVWAGLVLGVAGVTLLTSNGEFAVLGGELIGDLLAIASGLCWTVMILVYKWYMQRHPDAQAVSMNVVVFTVSLLVFAIASLPSGLAYKGTPESVWLVLYLGVLPTTGAYLLWQEGLRGLTAAVSSVLLLFETVVALAISIVLLDERLSGWSAVGAVLVLAAMYLASRAPRALQPLPIEAGAVAASEGASRSPGGER